MKSTSPTSPASPASTAATEPDRQSGRQRLLTGVIEHFAANGVGDISMRALAAALGTSHRMLHHHFGSRTGLLTAVVEAVEADQRALLRRLLSEQRPDPRAQLMRFWRDVSETALVYGPLFFELSSHAMHSLPHAESLRESLTEPWLEPLEQLFRDHGYDSRQAAALARTSLATARGLLFDLLLTGARTQVDAAMESFINTVVPRP